MGGHTPRRKALRCVSARRKRCVGFLSHQEILDIPEGFVDRV